MERGGLLVKIAETADLTLDTPVTLELVLPDGSAVRGDGKVLQVLAGLGVAVSVGSELVAQARQLSDGTDKAMTSPTRYQRLDGGAVPMQQAAPASPARPAPVTAPPRAGETPSNAEKIQKSRCTARATSATRSCATPIARCTRTCSRIRRSPRRTSRDREERAVVLRRPQADRRAQGLVSAPRDRARARAQPQDAARRRGARARTRAARRGPADGEGHRGAAARRAGGAQEHDPK